MESTTTEAATSTIQFVVRHFRPTFRPTPSVFRRCRRQSTLLFELVLERRRVVGFVVVDGNAVDRTADNLFEKPEVPRFNTFWSHYGSETWLGCYSTEEAFALPIGLSLVRIFVCEQLYATDVSHVEWETWNSVPKILRAESRVTTCLF